LIAGGDDINGFERCRREAGLTQIQSAQALGVAQCTISQWESDFTHPRAEMLPSIAKLYHCRIDDLYEKDSECNG